MPVRSGVGPNADLHIMNKNISPDGFNRSAVLAGSSPSSIEFPGPLITGYKGDAFNLNVIDSLTDPTMLRSTSIHGSAWADGPVGVTQCPISPGHSFMYTFKVPDQAGTFWYHSHLSTQYCDGLRGALVVYDHFDPHGSRYDIDNDDTVITLADWYHTPAPSAGLVPTPDATLINGLGRYTIIEVDGINVQPLTVDSIQTFAGQRFSFVLTADQPIANYWVRAKPNLGTTTFTGGLNSAILRYTTAPEADPTTVQTPSIIPMVETNLHPLLNAAAPGGSGPADVAINLAIAFNGTTRKFSINGATFSPPTVPVLLQIISGAQTAQSLLPAGSVYSLPRNKVIELTIPGGAAGSPHPIHLHGHEFSVIRSAGSSTYNYDNPVQRDVVSVGLAGDNVTIRFTTDNPGPWILHCHIDWHLEIGLAVVFAEDIPSVMTQNIPPRMPLISTLMEQS
ncbi:hypothetical protein H0H81_011243 [Sphagnurus paluster]|uniref:Laccase n=1 Tax=Sphagnurus paluster TaxID=117069 RepID=A0A9P7GPL9_9AGAR|nr:hypothetical protein H0H81_011243 [Sphagnurus paluster]